MSSMIRGSTTWPGGAKPAFVQRIERVTGMSTATMPKSIAVGVHASCGPPPKAFAQAVKVSSSSLALVEWNVRLAVRFPPATGW